MISAIIVAAGRGTRMGPGIDKLFLEVNGRPIVAHTWGVFDRSALIDEILLVVRAGMEVSFHDLAKQYGFTKSYRLVAGGKERQDSVWNGLEALSAKCKIVAIQDGARPCVTERLIGETIQAARETGAAVVALPITDTLKESNDGQFVARTLDRSRIWSVQTPQTFRVEIIRKALAEVRNRKATVTDDTAACELIGQAVRLVPSHGPNPKVTTPDDLKTVAAFLEG